MGVAQGIEGLAAIARAVGEVLTPIGYAPEDRPFRAHLTVARLGRPADVTPALAALGDDLVGGVWAAAEVVLYQSRLTRSGAEYTALARIPLRGSRAS
jgi:2'-5' RNA ligase